MASTPDIVQELLASVAAGDESATQRLFPLVYEHLHQIAESYMRQERSDHTLQPTALIHEAFLRLVRTSTAKDDLSVHSYENLDHFVVTAARVMRRVLVNHAKAKNAKKRSGCKATVQIEEIASAFNNRSVDLIALDAALERLSQLDSVQHRLVELRFFGGMSIEQAAEVLEISPRSAYYEWSYARAWLRGQLEDD